MGSGSNTVQDSSASSVSIGEKNSELELLAAATAATATLCCFPPANSNTTTTTTATKQETQWQNVPTPGTHRVYDESTPLIKALYDGDLNKAESLIATNPKSVFDRDTGCKHPAFLFACEAPNSLSIVKAMVERGVDPTFSECKKGIVGLNSALISYYRSRTELDLAKVNYLLEKVSRVDPSHSKPSCTPLAMAAQLGDREIVKTLIARGADVNRQLVSGRTALFVAAQHGNVGAMEELLEAKATVDVKDIWNGDTALHLAAKFGQTDAVRLLLDRSGDSINSKNDSGYSPLMLAAQEGHLEVCRLLISQGALVTDSTSSVVSTWTPLSLATANNRTDVVQFLKENGANDARCVIC